MGDYRLNYNHPRMDQIASTNHYEFEPTRNDSTYSGNSYYFPNTIGSSSGLWNQQGVRSNLVRRAMEEDHSKGLERFSQYQNPEIANMVLEEVSESIFELMTDHYGHKLYEKLIERCDDYHLARIVNKLTLQSNALVGASFMKYGSYSIQVLIKRVKGSEWAKLVTTNLSMPKAFCDLMRNKHGRHVVNPCFFKLDTWTNRVLFEAAIEHCVELAMDPVGDVSIIDCINSVRIPEQKKLLLQRISTNSLRLSFDTSGTFVVQHILELGNELFSDTICCHLKGKYVMLSQLQCGNFVVEKCLRASKLGLRYFVEDISHNEDILKKLARDKFGNYVIQTALEISKEACLFFSSARTLLSAILMNFL